MNLVLRHRIILAVLLVTISLSGACDSNSGADPGEEFDLIGKWEGVVTQAGGGYPILVFPISMEIDSLLTGKRAGSIVYLQLNCSGTLTFDRNSSGVYVFYEQIDVNQGNCTEQGRIDITETSIREISWEWHEIDGSGPFVTGTLSKK